MIIESILNMLVALIKILFGFINLPDAPPIIDSTISNLLGYVRSAIGIISLLIDWNLVKILIPLVIAVMNFEHLYRFVMFVIRKVPFLGMK